MGVAVVATVAMVSSSAWAQGPGRGRGGFGGPGGGKLMMLQDPAIRAEMEIVEDQEKELEQIRDEMRNTFREMFSGMRDLPEDKRREAFGNMREKMQEAMKDVEAKVNKVLLPNQVERLNELALQSRMRRGGAQGALADEELAKKLGITEEQKKKMTEVAQEAQKELQEKIQKAQQEARDKILGVLTKDQRAQLEKMTGKAYTPPPREDRRRRPGGGGQRGPGN